MMMGFPITILYMVSGLLIFSYWPPKWFSFDSWLQVIVHIIFLILCFWGSKLNSLPVDLIQLKDIFEVEKSILDGPWTQQSVQ